MPVIHGINGADLGLVRELPVDIAVNGKCALKGVQFTQSTQVALDKGKYQITVHPANGTCSAKGIIEKTLAIDDSNYFASFSVIASLTDTGTPRLAVYNNNESYAFSTAVAVRHLAFAPAVFAKIDVDGFTRGSPKRIKNGDLGETFAAWTDSISYKISITKGRKGGVLARLQGKTRAKRETWRIFHVVGSLKNGLAIVKQDVRFN